MANTVNSVLKGINNHRKNMINIIKNKNIDIADDANFSTILTILDTLPENTGEIPKPWQRPSYWPDTKTILDECEDLVIDSSSYKPFAILLFNTNGNTFYQPFYRNNQPGTLYFKLSDGQIIQAQHYNNENAHDWDTSKDIEIDGHKFRYCIMYMMSGNIGSDSVAYNYGTTNISTYLKSIIEVVDRDNYTASSGYGFKINLSALASIVSIIIRSPNTMIESGNQYTLLDSYANYTNGNLSMDRVNARYYDFPYKTGLTLSNISFPAYIKYFNAPNVTTAMGIFSNTASTVDLVSVILCLMFLILEI